MSFVKKILDKKKGRKEGRFCIFYNTNILTSFTVKRQEVPLISMGVLQ
jgi:hypothetical protein